RRNTRRERRVAARSAAAPATRPTPQATSAGFCVWPSGVPSGDEREPRQPADAGGTLKHDTPGSRGQSASTFGLAAAPCQLGDGILKALGFFGICKVGQEKQRIALRI